MDPAQITGAVLLIVVVTVSAIAAVVNNRSAGRRQIQAPTQLQVEDSDWTDADRYHGSRQWGR